MATGVSALMHFLVDGLCLCCMYLMMPIVQASHILGIFLTYNVLAFLTQPLTGLAADHMKRPHWMLLMSGTLLTLAVLLAAIARTIECPGAWSMTVAVVATLLGIGNSLFHAWGGRQTAVRTGNDIRALGVFVSTGAMGLAVGMMFCSWGLLHGFVLALWLLAIVYVMLDERTGKTSQASFMTGSGVQTWNVGIERLLPITALGIVLSMVVLMAFVGLRSFVGESFASGITKSRGIILMLGFVAMMGKMAGGWVARRLGLWKALGSVLVVALACLFLRETGWTAVLLGIFAMNCTMPMTLYLANTVLRGREGLAFGLLAAALIPGYLLTMC